MPVTLLGNGQVPVRVSSVYKTDTQTISSGVSTFVDITGLSITITPTSSSSRFLVIWFVTIGGGTDATHGYVRLFRNGSAIALADAAGIRTTASSSVVNTSIGGQTLMSSNAFLDSPATSSAVIYKLGASNGSGAIQINRSARDTNLAEYDGRSTSSLVVMEISG
jgi:hypothetical protein